jgi:hypothetical protein
MLLRVIIEALQKQHLRRKGRTRKGAQQTQENNSTATNAPLVYALARSWAWPALKFRCETHPHEVSELSVDERGETILHWTCLGKPPVETVQAILEVCPVLARIKNKAGHLPLHGKNIAVS